MLDINTPRGEIAKADQIAAAKIVFDGSEYKFHHTDTNGPARVDGVVTLEGMVVGVAEIKSRDMTEGDLIGQFKYEWLITMDKILDLVEAAKLLGVTGYGMLYLKPSQKVLVVRICDSKGNLTCKFRVEKTETQATCNGGTALRDNAFIDMRKARVCTPC